MKNSNKKLCIYVLLALLSLSNCVMADENSDYGLDDNLFVEQIKVNKDTFNNAQEAINNKDYKKAITLLSAYINEKPKKYEAYKLRGDAYYALRLYSLAQKDYQTAVDIKASSDKFMTNTKYVSAIVLGADKNEQLQNAELGDLYAALMYAQKAQNDSSYMNSYEKAVKYNSHIYLPEPNKGEINRINCPQKYGKIVNPQGVDAEIYGAIADIENENYNEALYKLQSVTNQYPAYYLGYYLTGVALSELEKDDDAVKSFNKAIELNPHDFESYASLGRIYYSKAETTFSAEDSKKSIDYFNKAIELNPNCPTYYFYIGMNELQNGNTNVAIYNFDKALKINQNDYNSIYYKLIAQYINGNYQDVIEDSTKLLHKHVSNYNSVLYLRALAYTKLNDPDKALQDLNSAENNIEDIYNTDIKQISSREKSLESYIHYLKSEIQHSKGAGAASDNTLAYSNAIINRLANAKRAIAPYEKSLAGETISINDYKKFESFYSTALPKLLESGAIITYEDIDNQYDYIRTTFDDIGVSFIYLNPNYKITTIKDYPYKKYSSKLSDEALNSLSARPYSEVKNVEMAKAQAEKLRKTTPASELLLQAGQSSIAQRLASDELAEIPNGAKLQSTAALKELAVKEEPGVTEFKPEMPDAENINTSKNIATGEIHESKTPLVSKENDQKVQSILGEEKNHNDALPVLRTNNAKDNANSISDENVKISSKTNLNNEKQKKNSSAGSESVSGPIVVSAKEIKPTEDIVVKYKDVKPATDIVSSTAVLADKTVSTLDDTKKQTEDKLKSKQESKKQEILEAEKQLQDNQKALKQAKLDAEKELKAQKKTEQKAKLETDKQLKLSQKATQQAAKEATLAVSESAQNIDAQAKEISKNVNSEATSIDKAVSNTAKQVVEKHANVVPSTYGVQDNSKPIIIDNINDVVELDANVSSKKITPDSELFNNNTVFSNPKNQIADIGTPVVLPEEPSNEKVNQKVSNNESKPEQKAQKENESLVNVVNVPKLNANENIAKEHNDKNNVAKTNEEAVVTVESLNESKELDKQYVQDQLSKVLDEITPQVSVNESKSGVVETIEQAQEGAKSIKQQKQEIQAGKELIKVQNKAAREKIKEEKAKLKEQRLQAKRDAKMKEALAKEQAKAAQALDETKIQKLKARLAAQKAAQKVQKEPAKAEESLNNSEKKSGRKNIFSKLKFWNKEK